jgi:DNA-binding transcriptional regulator LsrR (DeoR family)
METMDKQKLQRDVAISQLHLSGKSQKEIAAEIGISNATVSRVLSKEHIKELVNKAVEAMILRAPEVVKRLFEHIQEDNASVSMKAISEYNKVIGISQPHASLVIQNMYVDARRQTLSAEMVQVLSPGLKQLTDDDILDIY